MLLVLYLVLAFSNIPFIAKWRTLYIETAMSTHSHQWLAEWFLPQSVIDKVVAQKEEDLEQQEDLDSVWKENVQDEEHLSPNQNAVIGQDATTFFSRYWEIDTESVRKYLEDNPALTQNGYSSLLIEDFENNLGLKTVHGDPLLVLDATNNVMIIGVSGDGYQGKMAIVKNPAQVDLVKSKSLGTRGEIVDTYGERYDAVLAINASGFTDPEGHGAGGDVKGCLIIDGVEYGAPKGGTWKQYGFQYDDRLYITTYNKEQVSDYRWGIEFFPALIVNGEISISGSFGMGIQPRATIGQAANGDFMMLIVDGRQVGYSLGCTVADCADIMFRYGATQGGNLDGGSSAVMWYKGRQITSSSSASGNGRYMPDALIVRKASDPEVENQMYAD